MQIVDTKPVNLRQAVIEPFKISFWLLVDEVHSTRWQGELASRFFTISESEPGVTCNGHQ